MTPPLHEGTAHAWRTMKPEQRLAAIAAVGLFVSMFLPWYSKTNTLVVHGAVTASDTSLTAFQAFSFVEAAVLLVSAAVLAMLFLRVEGHAFQLPGGDGLIVVLAGGWTSLLIFYRLLDKPGVEGNERVTATVGVEWGIVVALLLALSLVYAGARMRAAEAPEPPLRRARASDARPGADHAPATRDLQRPSRDLDATVPTPRPVRRRAAPLPARERSRYPPPPPGQLSFEDPPGGVE